MLFSYFTVLTEKGAKFCHQKQEFTEVKNHEITGEAELSSKSDP